jgi:ubiquinone/menaquinone biosynthesis C-methylase UbiE/predicted RNA-binding Zn-ribbon protein involved in translation (DUF1610 family)
VKGWHTPTIHPKNSETFSNMPESPVCDYEGSDYQTSFWEQGGREYEDRAEAIALNRLLPKKGILLLEVGAGAGRNTTRYAGFDRVVLLDYSTTQLQHAQKRLGQAGRYIYVAADVYRLPFVDNLFDAATMIRTLHHMADAPKALEQVHKVLQPEAVFILEFANKFNLKSIMRFLLGRQVWSPFTLEPIEFVKLNFDFHPKAVRQWLAEAGFKVERTLTVSHFRMRMLKKLIPAQILAALDALLQPTGALWQLTPSVFMRSKRMNGEYRAAILPDNPAALFKCPECGHSPLVEKPDHLACPKCGRQWAFRDGYYDLRTSQ